MDKQRLHRRRRTYERQARRQAWVHKLPAPFQLIAQFLREIAFNVDSVRVPVVIAVVALLGAVGAPYVGLPRLLAALVPAALLAAYVVWAVTRRPACWTPPPRGGAGMSGVREPRRPLPGRDSAAAAVALEIPDRPS